MKKLTLKNNSDKDITDYPVAEAERDSNGDIVYDSQGRYKETNNTFEWSIKAGETVAFPEYVAKYLMGIYSFLEEVSSVEEETPEAKVKEGVSACKVCGQSFKGVKGLALHMAHSHPEKL